MIYILMIILLLVIFLLHRIEKLTLIMWMVENNLPQPSATDLSRLSEKVVENLLKDITGGWSKKS